MYFSANQIASSIRRLGDLNPFFGTAFLAFKHIHLPVGSKATINFSQVMDDILFQYYHPTSAYDGFYSPFMTSNRNKRWNSIRYGSTTLQRIAADTFSDALLHIKNTRDWGWTTNYIEVLRERHLGQSSIPAFDLAVWLFRNKSWGPAVAAEEVVNHLFTEFFIDEAEKSLFDTSTREARNLFESWLDETPVDERTLLDIIGHPPGTLEESARLQVLQLVNVGPVTKVEMELAPRLNLITGDNGLGKTFLLDCCWWALTETWASPQALPHQNGTVSEASISFRVGRGGHDAKLQTAKYNSVNCAPKLGHLKVPC